MGNRNSSDLTSPVRRSNSRRSHDMNHEGFVDCEQNHSSSSSDGEGRRSSSVGSSPPPHFTLLVIGDRDVAKTALMDRLGHEFMGCVSGTQHCSLMKTQCGFRLQDELINLSIWFIENEHSATQCLRLARCREAHGVFFVYNRTSSSSFETAKGWASDVAGQKELCDVVKVMVSLCDPVVEEQEAQESSPEMAHSLPQLFTEQLGIGFARVNVDEKDSLHAMLAQMVERVYEQWTLRRSLWQQEEEEEAGLRKHHSFGRFFVPRAPPAADGGGRRRSLPNFFRRRVTRRRVHRSASL